MNTQLGCDPPRYDSFGVMAPLGSIMPEASPVGWCLLRPLATFGASFSGAGTVGSPALFTSVWVFLIQSKVASGALLLPSDVGAVVVLP